MKTSILQEELAAILLRLGEPKMLRPDLGTLYGRAFLAEVEAMEREGLLRPDGAGALVYKRQHPPKEDEADIDQVLFNLGVVWKPVADRLRALGGRTTERS